MYKSQDWVWLTDMSNFTYVLESVWELVHASFLNWTMENNENTEKRFYNNMHNNLIIL